MPFLLLYSIQEAPLKQEPFCPGRRTLFHVTWWWVLGLLVLRE
jgi:hypothetical protein